MATQPSLSFDTVAANLMGTCGNFSHIQLCHLLWCFYLGEPTSKRWGAGGFPLALQSFTSGQILEKPLAYTKGRVTYRCQQPTNAPFKKLSLHWKEFASLPSSKLRSPEVIPSSSSTSSPRFNSGGSNTFQQFCDLGPVIKLRSLPVSKGRLTKAVRIFELL